MQTIEHNMLLVVAGVIINNNKVLISKRPEGKHLSNLWEFPGGKIETGETPESALIRELREELNIDTSLSCLAPLSFASHHYDASDGEDAFHLLMMLFVCRRWQGRPQPMEGGTLKWVRPQNLREYQMPAADIPLISVLQDIL